mgnify:CR=1 FL=1
MKRTADAVIVGAGITGLAIAREMAKRGAFSIMIVVNTATVVFWLFGFGAVF